MIVRILIAAFASLVSGFSYVVGLVRLMTGLLVGFTALCALLLGILFLLPVDAERRLLPVYEPVPAWPYLLLALLLGGMVVALFKLRVEPAPVEPVSARHRKYLLAGVGGYLTTLFLSSIWWFPADEHRLAADPERLAWEVFFGTGLYLLGISISCIFLYRASRGGSPRYPDMMRRFVLGLFAFFQLDKMPLLVTYLLLYSPDSRVIFPNIAGLALASAIPVAAFLIRASWDSRNDEPTASDGRGFAVPLSLDGWSGDDAERDR